MADGGLTLAQDLCARLCHDLVGPLGTMANAVEMVGDDPDAAELAREAAASLRAKLQLWRAACGAGTGCGSCHDRIDTFLRGVRASDGLLNVWVPHATAGLAVIETGAGSDTDLLAALRTLLPADDLATIVKQTEEGRTTLSAQLPAVVPEPDEPAR